MTALPWSCPEHSDERNCVGVDARNIAKHPTLESCDILVVGEAPGPEEYKEGW